MSFPPLRPSRDSTPANDPQPTLSGSVRSRQSAWGLSASQSSSRRELNQLDTTFPSVGSAASARSSNLSANNNLGSQFAGQFSPISAISSSGRLSSSRNTPSISSTISPFATFQSGGLQTQQLSSSQLLASRSNTTTPFQQINSASSAAASTSVISQGGGGGSGSGGGTNRLNTFGSSSASGITSPTSSVFDRTTFTSNNSAGANPNHSSVLKISITQLVLLLGSITEKEGKAKWESQADAIRKVSYLQTVTFVFLFNKFAIVFYLLLN